MTTFAWLHKQGLTPQIDLYLKKGKERPLIEAVLSLSPNQLLEYAVYKGIEVKDALNTIFKELQIDYEVQPVIDNEDEEEETLTEHILMYVPVIIAILSWLFVLHYLI